MGQGAEKLHALERFGILSKRLDALFSGAGDHSPTQRDRAILDCMACMEDALEEAEYDVRGHA